MPGDDPGSDAQGGPDAGDAGLGRGFADGRRFTMAEALGRLAGPGAMKGGSPLPRQRQAAAAIAEALERHLEDPGGVLRRVLLREMAEGGALLADPDHPVAVLADEVRRTLASAPALAELVRATDEAWGQEVGERPFFEHEGRPPDPDDPYTVASVGRALTALLAALPSAAG